MQAIFDMLELNKRIVEGIVEVIESDDKSKVLVKMKKLFRIIKSKSYKEKQDKMQEIILQSKNRIQQITEATETNENDRSSEEEISDMSLDNDTIDQWISLCEEALEFKNYKELSRTKRKKINHDRVQSTKLSINNSTNTESNAIPVKYDTNSIKYPGIYEQSRKYCYNKCWNNA